MDTHLNCHNKKEEKDCMYGGICAHDACFNRETKEEGYDPRWPNGVTDTSSLRDFNRETPKKCPTCGHSKEMGTVARCTSEFHKEEVQLPEKLIWDKQTANAKEIYWTVNAILDYLKAHE